MLSLGSSSGPAKGFANDVWGTPLPSVSHLQHSTQGSIGTYRNSSPFSNLPAERPTAPRLAGLEDSTTPVSRRSVPAYSPPLDWCTRYLLPVYRSHVSWTSRRAQEASLVRVLARASTHWYSLSTLCDNTRCRHVLHDLISLAFRHAPRIIQYSPACGFCVVDTSVLFAS